MLGEWADLHLMISHNLCWAQISTDESQYSSNFYVFIAEMQGNIRLSLTGAVINITCRHQQQRCQLFWSQETNFGTSQFSNGFVKRQASRFFFSETPFSSSLLFLGLTNGKKYGYWQLMKGNRLRRILMEFFFWKMSHSDPRIEANSMRWENTFFFSEKKICFFSICF